MDSYGNGCYNPKITAKGCLFALFGFPLLLFLGIVFNSIYTALALGVVGKVAHDNRLALEALSYLALMLEYVVLTFIAKAVAIDYAKKKSVSFKLEDIPPGRFNAFPYYFPEIVPYVLTAFAFVLTLNYFMSGMNALMLIGRPSSTAGVAFMFILFIPLFFGLVAALMGVALQKGYTLSGQPRIRISGRVVAGIYIFLLVAGFFPYHHEWKKQEAYEQERRPHVVYSSGAVEKISSLPEGQIGEEVAALLFGEPSRIEVSKSMDWNGDVLNISEWANRIKLLVESERLKAEVDLSDYSYITRISVVPYGREGEKKGLALLVHFRATSNRSMLLVFDPSLQLLYKETLGRSGLGGEMRVYKYSSRDDVLYVNTRVPFYYSFKVE